MGSNDSISEAVFNDDKVKRLELYKSDTNDYEYNFNGVIISRLKVLRYYDTLRKNGKTGDDSLLFAATFNSMLDENEFEAVRSCVEDALVRRKK